MTLARAEVAANGGHLDYDFSKIDPAVRRLLRPLCRLDNWHGPMAVALDAGTVVFAAWCCVAISWWLYPVVLVLIGSTHRALANLLHESAHKILARNPVLNLLLGTVFSGYLIFHMYVPYRSTHVGFHHRFLGDPDKDPDYRFHRDCGLYCESASHTRFFIENIMLAVLGLRTPAYIRYIVRDRIFYRGAEANVSQPIRLSTERMALAAEWITILALCASTGSLWYLLLFWIIPLFTVTVAIGWLSEIAEHYPLPESEHATVLMTRNRHGCALENYLFGRHHDNYHLVHHLSMGIPFWNMRRAHAHLLNDPAYSRWDALWGGIFTRGAGRPGTETVISYSRKYREWRRCGGRPDAASPTFAEALTLARR